MAENRLVFPTGVGVNRRLFISSIVWNVFPTGVGVNRLAGRHACLRDSFPHRRGGEPANAAGQLTAGDVFPTGVGVNRRGELVNINIVAFSPQAWG